VGDLRITLREIEVENEEVPTPVSRFLRTRAGFSFYNRSAYFPT
jgi:hypothetical protein